MDPGATATLPRSDVYDGSTMATTLIDAATLRDHLADPEWVVIDCRFQLDLPASGHAAYREGHIPGAHYASLDHDLSAPASPEGGRHPLPDVRSWSARLSTWGIGADTQVIAYDDQGGVYASRLWWMLRWIGHTRVAVLDGGMRAWVAANGPVSIEQPVRRTHTDELRVAEVLYPVTTPVVAAFVEGRGEPLIVIDARGPKRYRGEEEPFDRIGGHVPGALNRPFSGNLADDGCFLSAARLRASFQASLSRFSPPQVVHMCGSGVSACHNLLAMEHAGLTGSRLYVGSWSAWCSDPQRPVATGD